MDSVSLISHEQKSQYLYLLPEREVDSAEPAASHVLRSCFQWTRHTLQSGIETHTSMLKKKFQHEYFAAESHITIHDVRVHFVCTLHLL